MYGSRTNVPSARSCDSAPASFGDLFSGFFTTPFTSGAATLSPPIDVVENSEDYVMKLDLPGLSQEQVDVHFANNVLTVQGATAEESKSETDRWHVVERSRGSFARSVKFPVNVDPTRVKAAMKNGVLTIVVPKAETAKTQKIKVTEA